MEDSYQILAVKFTMTELQIWIIGLFEKYVLSCNNVCTH